jgi:hypothetical protein
VRASAGLGGQSGQQDGDQTVSVGLNPLGTVWVPAGKFANLGCVDVGQRCAPDEHVVADLVVDRSGDAGLSDYLPCRCVPAPKTTPKSPPTRRAAAFQEILKYGRASGVQLGDYDIAQYAGAFGATGIRINSIDEFENAFKQSLSDSRITIIDVPVDYTRNTELFAQLHDGVFE